MRTGKSELTIMSASTILRTLSFLFCLRSYVWYFSTGNGGNAGSVTLHYRKLNGQIQSQVCGGTGAEPANNGQGGNGNYLTNRFHFAVRLYSANAQRTSKRGKNICHATRLWLVAYFFVLTTFWTSSVRYQSTDPRQNRIYLF